MGTHKSITVDANTNDIEILNSIKEVLKKHGVEECFRTNLVYVGEWWPDEMIKELMNKFPKVMFRIDTSLDKYPTFYLGGIEISGHWLQDWVQNMFPSFSRFKKGVQNKNVHNAEIVRNKEKKELAIKKEKEKQQKRRELAELDELERLKYYNY